MVDLVVVQLEVIDDSEEARALALCTARRLLQDENATPDVSAGPLHVRVQVENTDAHALALRLRDECAETLGIEEPWERLLVPHPNAPTA